MRLLQCQVVINIPHQRLNELLEQAQLRQRQSCKWSIWNPRRRPCMKKIHQTELPISKSTSLTN
jgi:hypothetical protein